MRRMYFFARRNALEILRDPISLFFGICFPIILLLLLSLINSAIPVEAGMTLYSIENLAPGIASFGLCFLALFASMLVSKDRGSSLMLRLFTSPLTAWEFIGGYCLPMLPMAIIQVAVCYLAAIGLGLPLTINIVPSILAMIPTAALYIFLGLLLGTVLPEKAVGGICGALLTNLAGWLSGTWFSVEMIGGVFEKVCKLLPFYSSAQLARLLLDGHYEGILPHLACTLIWAAIAGLAAIFIFLKSMKSDK